MPITQTRIKQLVDAAQSVIATHIGQCNTLGELTAQFRAGHITLETLLEYVSSRAFRPDAIIASEMIVINREESRWQFSHNKNEQEARRIARRRAEGKLPAKRKDKPVLEQTGDQLVLHNTPDPDANIAEQDLFGEEPEAEYIPGELTQEQKDEINRDMTCIHAATDGTQFTCQHGDTPKGQRCKRCNITVE